MQVLRGEQDNIEVAGQRAMLKTVVKNMNRGVVLFLGKHACLISAFANYNGAAKPLSDQERLVSEIERCAVGGDGHCAVGFTSISAGEDIECNATLFQQFAQQDHERGFARSADRNISDADYWTEQLARFEDAAVVQAVASCGDQPI